mmetsp:Transcript_29342/g.89859  ORF Transcript_29342/g.89859 Transcript_29342/m.89859 type:complete len:80 (-) Transcript_29342:174-413(-)
MVPSSSLPNYVAISADDLAAFSLPSILQERHTFRCPVCHVQHVHFLQPFILCPATFCAHNALACAQTRFLFDRARIIAH